MISFLLVCFAATGLGELPNAPVVRLTVSPMAAPRPALKYQLLPEVREMQAGNPVQWYLRSFAEQRNFFFDRGSVADRQRYRTLPFKDVPGQKLKGYGGSALTQADWGARLDTADWQVLDRVQSEGAALNFPELTSLQILGEALQVRFRGEVARRDFDAAIVTAKTMFALARHLGECPVLAANRVGLAIADMALQTLEEMIQQPDCPNLYWAFTDLPTPLVEIRKGMQGERAHADEELKSLRDDAMTPEDIEKLVSRLSGRVGFAREQAGLPPRNVRAVLEARIKDENGLTNTRLRLAGQGKWNALGLPPAQVVLLDEKRAYEARRDEETKLISLAPWQARATKDNTPKPRATDGLFLDLLPNIPETHLAQARLHQRIALLRQMEALRMFAATHHSSWPARLDDTNLPLSIDPFTGKPFGYSIDGTRAQLVVGTSNGHDSGVATSIRYEISIEKERR